MRNEKLRNQRASLIECVLVGTTAAICAVIGHNIYICAGVAEGIALSVLLPLILFFVPASLAGFLLTALVAAIGARWLSMRPVFRDRTALRAALIMMGALLIANWLAYFFDSRLICTAGTWN